MKHLSFLVAIFMLFISAQSMAQERSAPSPAPSGFEQAQALIGRTAPAKTLPKPNATPGRSAALTVCVTTSDGGGALEKSALAASLTALGFNVVLSNDPAASGCAVFVSHPGSYFLDPIPALSWVNDGGGYVQISDWGSNYIDNAGNYVYVDFDPVTVTTGSPTGASTDGLLYGLPASWTSFGFWINTFGGYIGGATNPSLPNLAATSSGPNSKARSLTGQEQGEGRLVYIGFNVYGSLAGCEDLQVLQNAILWAAQQDPASAGPAPCDSPCAWETVDIGNPGPGNSYDLGDCETDFTINAGALNNSPAGDNMGFIAQELCGDFELTAQVVSITPNGYAGLMARESGATGSKMIGVFSNHSSLVRVESRSSTNGSKATNFFQKPAPYWLKLVRQGNWFFAYSSFNGVNYSIVTAKQLSMNSCLEVGMAAFSNIPGSTATAVFGNVGINGGDLETIQLPGNTVETAPVERNISLFPNPAQDVVTVEMGVAQGHGLPIPGLQSGAAGETTLRLRNELGQLLETRRIDADTERFDWNISSLKPGLYFIEIHEEGQAPQMLRFVKAE